MIRALRSLAVSAALLAGLSAARSAAISPVLSAAEPGAAEPAVAIEKADGGRYDVKLDGKLFTTLHTEEFAKPILYPIIGPHGIRMTRDYPMKPDTPEEARDHPHHQSLWYTHGDVNGVDFWALGKGKIVTRAVEGPVERGSGACVVLRDEWRDPRGKVVCTDTQTLTFHAPLQVGGNDVFALDYEIAIHASEGDDVTFGDTKEGTMGIRTHPRLRTDKGAAAVNSEGASGKDLWGKRAKWVDYSNEIDGKKVGIAILDHPSNPRHPTWWHAREYGLVAANPFGIRDFERKKEKEGDLRIPDGETVTFRYRFLFHGGDAGDARVAERWTEWAAGASPAAGAAGVAAPAASGQPAASAHPAASGEGFVPLFDGKTLEGWEAKGGKAKYRVEDGAIVGETVPNTGNSFLSTTKAYADFILEYEFLCDDALNSGVQIRSSAYDEPKTYEADGKTTNVPAGRVHGYQVEIDPNSPNRMWTSGIYDEGRRGWLYPGQRGGDPAAFSEQGKRLYRKGEWNRVRVEAVGPRIKTWLNGDLRVDMTDDMTPSGFVALQVHGVGGREDPLRVRWRDIRIQVLGGK